MKSAAKLIAAAAMPLLAVSACSWGHAATRRPAQPSRTVTSPSPTPSLAAYPHVNKPCQGKIPEPFAGIATNGQFGTTVSSFQHDTGRTCGCRVHPTPFRIVPAREAQQIATSGRCTGPA
jgi:hypothetical protein